VLLKGFLLVADSFNLLKYDVLSPSAVSLCLRRACVIPIKPLSFSFKSC
jgi:hypothetical protein